MAIAVVGLVAFVVAGPGETPGVTRSGIEETRPVAVVGALPRLDSPNDDPAVGLQAPVVRGAGFDGTAATIGVSGRPTLVVFLAHWCGHCRAELPDLVRWMADGVTTGVDVFAVSTAVNPALPNFPPSTWLADERWSAPVIADDAKGTAATAFGMPGTPYYVAVDARGLVARRASGEIGRRGIETLIMAARQR